MISGAHCREAPTGTKTTAHRCLGFTGLLLLAAILRFVALPDVPPGVAHDEVAEILIAERILAGHHALFFREAYGQEPLFLYLVAGMRALLGREILGLRFVSASVGLLTVAAGARLAKRLFNTRTALLTGAGISVMLWPVFWSRVGLRAMTLPLTMCLGVDALWLTVQGRRPYRSAVIGGLWFGLSAYTYLASRAVPLVLLSFGLLLWIFHRARFHQRWRALAMLALVAALIALPLAAYLMRNKTAQTRVYQVDAPLRALREGNPGPIVRNTPRVLGMFTGRGDATERNNYPYRPVFVEPLWSLSFYLGVIIAVVRFKDVRYSWLLVWLVAMLVPSWVTTEAPNFVRALGALPAVMILPALAMDGTLQWLRAGGMPLEKGGHAIIAFAFLLNVGLTTHTYFVRWPQIPEVHFVWQKGLAAIGDWLDAHTEVASVTVGGLSNRTMDAPSLDLLMRRDDITVRWCDPGSPQGAGGGLLLPAEGGRLLVPSIVPLNADLAAATLNRYEPQIVDHGDFCESRLPVAETAGTVIAFEGDVGLVNVSVPSGPFRAGDDVVLYSVWQAIGDNLADLKVFVHLIDGEGALRAQHDGLDCPMPFWQAGDRAVQSHRLQLPEDLETGRYTLRIGLYHWESMSPYVLLDGRPYYEIGHIEIRDS